MPGADKTTAEQGERTPFQRFEDFARKIIAVPKREIDEAANGAPPPEDDPPIDPDREKRGPTNR
jgi:hypothetical protein